MNNARKTTTADPGAKSLAEGGGERSQLLTAKQEAFCLAYMRCGIASAAYREAGYSQGMSSKSVNEASSLLLRNPKITTRLAELRAPAARAAQITLQTHLADLLWLREVAAGQLKYSAAVQAEIARGRAAGLYVERAEIKAELPDDQSADLSLLSDEELAHLEALLRKAQASE